VGQVKAGVRRAARLRGGTVGQYWCVGIDAAVIGKVGVSNDAQCSISMTAQAGDMPKRRDLPVECTYLSAYLTLLAAFRRGRRALPAAPFAPTCAPRNRVRATDVAGKAMSC